MKKYTNNNHDATGMYGVLAQSFMQFRERLKPGQFKFGAPIDPEVLQGIESYAAQNPDSAVAQMRAEMLRLMGPNRPVIDPSAFKHLNGLYRKTSAIVYPATVAFLDASHDVNEYSLSQSLSAMDLGELYAIDEKAHKDVVLDTFRTELITKLRMAAGIDDVKAFGQAFEKYGEIIAYLHLRDRLRTERIPERDDKKTPDFRCETRDGKSFHVEVKTFDIVGGDFRNRAIMNDGLDARVELDEQVRTGRSFARATTEIAPYLKPGETEGYDPFSLIRVIDTLREKCFQAFREGQLRDAPTLALTVLDRLLLPGGESDLAPYYYTGLNDGVILSGVLWQMAYGRQGTPILRLPHYAGDKSVEGLLGKSGLFVDEGRPFPAPGLIVLHRLAGSHRSLGLVNEACSDLEGWSIADTQDVLEMLCDSWNDRDGTRSCYISAKVAEEGETNS